MSRRQRVLDRIRAERVIAVARSDGAKNLLGLAGALGELGIGIFEVTMTTPGALEGIHELTTKLPGVSVGAGTVLTEDMAKQAIAAGAQFLVSPILDSGVVRLAQEAGVAVIPGTFTPTEAYRAWGMGADAVKVFPAAVLGPAYVSSIRAPLPQLEIVPTGGINLDNASSFLEAGAAAVALGTSLIDCESLRTGSHKSVLERAEKLIECIGKYRDVGC